MIQPVFDCVINRFIFPRVTVIFFSTYTHHLYLNNFDKIDDQYFDENKSIYKEEVLRVLRHLVLPVDEGEDPATLDKETFLLKYSDAVDHLCEIRYYMGYKIGEHVFHGLNCKSVADTEKLLENNFDINFKLELFIPETGHGLHTSMFLHFFEKDYNSASVQQGPRMMDDSDFPYSTKLMYLLSLSTEK